MAVVIRAIKILKSAAKTASGSSSRSKISSKLKLAKRTKSTFKTRPSRAPAHINR